MNSALPSPDLPEWKPPFAKSYVKPMLVWVHRDWVACPFFVAVPQKGPRIIELEGRRYEIGVPSPLHPTGPTNVLDIRHARAFLALGSFGLPDRPEKLIPFSMREFCRRYANSNGGRYSRDIRAILHDLTQIHIRILYPEEQRAVVLRILEKVWFEEQFIRRRDSQDALNPQMELWLNGVQLSVQFFDIVSRMFESLQIRLDVLTSFRSNIAAAIYLYMPSRAAHRTAADPFPIKLSTVLDQIGYPERPRWLRKQIFTQRHPSVIEQLDNTPTWSGYFRVKLVEGKDDFMLHCWMDKPADFKARAVNRDRKCYQWWKASGRSDEEYDLRMLRRAPLDSYELALAMHSDIELDKVMRLLETARALIGSEKLRMLLSEAKGYALEKVVAKRNPTARLIFHIKEAISSR